MHKTIQRLSVGGLSLFMLTTAAVPLGSDVLAEENFSVRVALKSSNCRDTERRETRFCAPEGWRIIGISQNILSQNGRSSVQAQRLDERCYRVVAVARPHGEDRFLGIANCKGRGWITADLIFTGEPKSLD